MIGYSYSISGQARVLKSLKEYRKLQSSPAVNQVCAKLRDIYAQHQAGMLSKEDYEQEKQDLKKRLPIVMPHAIFTGTRRRNEEALPSGFYMFDIDHVEDPRALYTEKVSPLFQTLPIVYAAISASEHGLRLILRRNMQQSIEDEQKALAEQLGVEYDSSTKDLARCSFVVPQEYELFVDEALFTSPLPEVSTTTPAVYPRKQGVESEALAIDEFEGVPFNEIIKKWWDVSGGEPQMGSRNVKLHELARALRYITDNSEQTLLKLMPRYGLSETEMQQLIHSACSGKLYTFPTRLRTIVDSLKQTTDNSQPTSVIPPMPKVLPPLIKLLVSKTPKEYRPAVAHAVFPSLGAHLYNCRFTYLDGVPHEATLMNLLMAGTGAGKSCIQQPINFIMEDIRAQDEINMQREQEWKREVMQAGADKDKTPRPDDLIIQEVDPDITNPAFVLRTKDAQGRFLYCNLNEVDQFDALKGSGRGGQQFQIMLLAFDPYARYGQTRVSANSITEKVKIRFNWNAATTTARGIAYFKNQVASGVVSRLNICTIPEREIGAPMPKYGVYDEAFRRALAPYLSNLSQTHGDIQCSQALKLIESLLEQDVTISQITQNRVYENFSFRANVIVYLKAMVLYVAHGCRWLKSFEDFLRWSHDYDLYCKMLFFEQYAHEREEKKLRPGMRNLLLDLENTFSYADAQALRAKRGMDVSKTDSMLSVWKSRKYIESLQGDMYKKLKFTT